MVMFLCTPAELLSSKRSFPAEPLAVNALTVVPGDPAALNIIVVVLVAE
jgi:hypothetical protein